MPGMEQAKLKRKAEEKERALEAAKRARVAAAAPQATGGGPPADDGLYQALAKEDSTVCRQASRDARQACVNTAGSAERLSLARGSIGARSARYKALGPLGRIALLREKAAEWRRRQEVIDEDIEHWGAHLILVFNLQTKFLN